MDHPEGAGFLRADQADFNPRVRLELRGTQPSSDGGLLVMRELDDALGLSDLASAALCDTRCGKNASHRLNGLFRQLVYRRLAGYENVNDADRLALDPVMGDRAVDMQAASASQMGRFETETLALPENWQALADLNGQWIDRFHDRNGLKHIVLDMDSSVSPTHGDQEGAAWNGHFDCTCYHPNFLFNQFGMLERCALRNGNVHSADGWRDVLNPVIPRYMERKLGGRFFRADAAYAIPALYERLEETGYFYTIRLPANTVLREKIAHRLTRPEGRASLTEVKRFYDDVQYQAASWDKPRRVVAKIGWHPGELFPRAGFMVTNMPMDPDWVVRFYNQRGTAEQHIKEGKYAFRWTLLSCRKFRDNEVQLQLNALAYNLATFLRCIELPGGHGGLVIDQPATEADQDRGACRASRSWHHFPTGRGGRHRPDGTRHPRCHSPIASATVMRVTAIRAQTERKRRDRSVRCAERHRRRARTRRLRSLIRPVPAACPAAEAVPSRKCLSSGWIQADLHVS